MPFITQIGNQIYNGLQSAHNAAMAVMSHLYNGLSLLNNEEKQKRLDVCATCPIRNGDWCGDGKTKGCGCYLPAKTALPLESCPSGYWSVHESASGIIEQYQQQQINLNSQNSLQNHDQPDASGCTPCEQKRRLAEELLKLSAQTGISR